MSAERSGLTDHELLARYVKKRDGQAFSTLVNRYVDLVYTAAMRQVRHAHQAEDVTQAVFLILSQRAKTITSQVVLPGWLLITARNCSRNAMVSERRLKDRERKAATMKPTESESSENINADAEAVSPILDEALANLNEEDRNAIVHRFFQSKSHREVGEALGVSEDAASQRVIRALDKMRTFLARQGVTTSQAALSAALPLIAVKSAPPALAAAVSGGLMGASGAVAAIAKPVLGGKTVSAALIGWGSAAAVAIAVTAGVIVVQNQKASLPSDAPIAAASQPTAIPEAKEEVKVLPAAAAATQLTVSVIDPKTRKPITDAEIQLTQGGGITQNWIKVDDQGKAVVPIPNQQAYSQLFARAPGRVQSRLVYSGSPIRGDHPGELSFPLEQGILIGGTVVDADGQPIPEARVQFSTNVSNRNDQPEPSYQGVQVVTDAEGHWSYEQASSDLGRIYISASHPTMKESSSQVEGGAEELKTETAKIVLKRYIPDTYTRTGQITDEAGKPVVGAKVMWYYSRYNSTKPTTITDDQGNFKISNNDSESNPITVIAPGYGPQVMDSEQVVRNKSLAITLKAPRKFEGSLLDEQGKPVKGAKIELASIGNRDAEALDWSAKTDADGKFVWTEAPQELFKVTVSLKNKSRLYNIPIVPNSGPVSLTMYPQLEIEGKVVDADTREPIPSFRMDYGVRWTGQEDVTWQSQDNRAIANGKYAATMLEFNNGGKLRVKADGYLPVVSRMIEAKEGANGKVVVNFELKKGKGPGGIILGPEGEPVADADVILLPTTSGFSVDFKDPVRNLRNYSGVEVTKTDEKGKFNFQPTEGEHRLFVACEQGVIVLNQFAKTENQEIRLNKWGSIEGVIKVNDSPGAEVEVFASPSHSGEQIFFYNIPTVKTNSEGKFSFPRLLPGNYTVGRARKFNNGHSTVYMDGKIQEVRAGETTTYTFGGVGRPVTGKLNIPKDIADKVQLGAGTYSFAASSQNKSMFNPFDVVEFPAEFPDWDRETRRKWKQETIQKPKMAAMFKAMRDRQESRAFSFLISPDGTFQGDDILPGSYSFTVVLQEPYDHTINKQGETHGTVTGEFVVPDKPAVPNNEVLNVGEFSLGTNAAKFAVGESLPRIALTTVDGKAFDYDAYKGKVLILHVWSLDSTDNYAQPRELEQKFKSFPNTLFAHVGYETLAPWAKRVAEREKWEGINLVGTAEFNKQYNPAEWIPWACNYNSPSYIVVDGDGKLVGHTSKPDELENLVKKAGSR